MRQGPYYSQWVDRDEYEAVRLRLPLELEDEWSKFDVVKWKDNGDGSYTLYPNKEY